MPPKCCSQNKEGCWWYNQCVHPKEQMPKEQLPGIVDPPVKQVRASEAWASALGWWVRTYPGRKVDMGRLIRRSDMKRSTAYEYLARARQAGLLDLHNVPMIDLHNVPVSHKSSASGQNLRVSPCVPPLYME